MQTFDNSAHQEFAAIIKSIGRGQRSGVNLDQRTAERAMHLLVSDQVSDLQRGAFLMLLRVREETPVELAGFLTAIRHYTTVPVAALNADLDIGVYAGKRRHPPWFFLAVLLLTQQGKRVFLHGHSEPGSKRFYLDKCLRQMGIGNLLCSDSHSAQHNLDAHGVCYMPLSSINPSLARIIDYRADFGLRSCANTLARMLNPTDARTSVQGVFHRGLDMRHQGVAELTRASCVIAFRGEGGEVEINPERELCVYSTRTCKDASANVCNSEIESSMETIAALQSKPSIKPRHLHGSQLINLWQGQSDQRAELAVVGTLAVFLMALNQTPWATSLQTARLMWRQRDKRWPFAMAAVASE